MIPRSCRIHQEIYVSGWYLVVSMASNDALPGIFGCSHSIVVIFRLGGTGSMASNKKYL
ncbi:MAG: hypothetical protein PHF64_07565 [Methanoregula sp.]|nr:hypothetical protein [Methanoregula sp.]